MRLRARLVLWSVGVTLASLAALVTLVGALLWRAEVRAVGDEALDRADALLAVVGTPRAAGALAGGGPGVRTWVTGEAGKPPDPAFVAAGAEGPPSRTVRIGAEIVASRRANGTVVQVARSLAPARRTLDRYVLVAGTVGAAVAGLAGLVTALAVGGALAPLEALAARVRRLDTPDAVPGVQRGDELGTLARALDLSLRDLRARRVREALFLANASHELRTPVAALLADVQHARARDRTPDELRAALGRAERAALRLQDLTANLLSMLRAGHRADLRDVDLLDLAGDVVDRLQPLAIRAGLDLHLDGGAARVHADPSLVTRALENLVGNALKFSPAGEVTVTVRAEGDVAEVRVEDRGLGLPDETRRLFEPFERGGPAATNARPEGFGLGLAVVREVARAHGGRVRLEPREGGGTRARLLLPVEPGSSAPD